MTSAPHTSACLAAVAAALLLALAPATAPAEQEKWEKLENCTLADAYMDGDSFHVLHGTKDIIIRLYFVDTPETDTTYMERNTAQAEYFGIPLKQVVPVGELGKKFTHRLLAHKKFTVWTRWRDARGSSAQKRYFGIVLIGKDNLAELLVQNGLARVYGVSTVMPDGRSGDAEFSRLRQMEHRAKAKRLGGWAKSAKRDEPGMFDEDLDEDAGEEGTAEESRPAQEDAADSAPAAAAAPVEETTPKQWFNVPTVAFLRAEAFINTEQFEDAEIEMRKLLARFPDHPQRPRIEFYLALSLAMQEKFEESVSRFKDWLAAHPGHQLEPDVRYWMPIALYYDGKYEEALPCFEAYAKENPLSIYAPEAAYRAACCRYALEDYERCAADVAEWLREYPNHYFRYEATIMRGDALAGIGEFDEAKAAYRQALVPAAGAFYYMALTQIARVHKAIAEPDEYQEMSREYVQYIKDMPQDSNIVDAAYNAGWALRQLRQVDRARSLYWQMIELHGNVPVWDGFDLMLADLAKMYPRDTDDYANELRDRYSSALSKQRIALAARLYAASIQLLPEEEQTREIAAFAGRFNTEVLGPETLVWLGREWIRHGMASTGIADLEFLVSCYPDSRHVPEACMLLAQQAVDNKEWDTAYELANSVVENAAELDVLVEATFCRAEALRGLGKYEESIADYNSILANRAAPRRLKPEALLGIAACLEAQKEWNQANAYYQRVFVLYRAYKPQVAAAYLSSGACFERTGEKQKAINTYREFLADDISHGTAAAAKARDRIAQLGGTP